jgi:signal transduction histidine kinase
MVTPASWLDLPAAEAEQQLVESLASARAAGLLPAQAQALITLGRVRGPQGREADALAAFAEARALTRQLGDATLQAQVDIAQAWHDVDYGHHARALAACRQAAEKARLRGDDLALRQTGFVTASSLVHLGEHDLAVEHFEESRVALLASPGGLSPASLRRRHGRYLTGLAQAWLMRAGLLLEAGGRQAAGDAFVRARQYSEQACESLLDASPRQWAPALFGLQRVLLEAGEIALARQWAQRPVGVPLHEAPPGSLAMAQLVLGQAMVDLRAGDVEPATILRRLQALDGATHPRVVAGDLRLALLRCLFEAHEQAGQYEQALNCQHQWAEQKARLRGRLAAEHGRWTAETLAAWRSEADAVVTTAFRAPLRQAVQRLDAALADAGGAAMAGTSLARARHSVGRAIDIADQYLGVMRAEHLRAEDMQVLDLAALVDDVCEQMAPPAGASVRLVREVERPMRVRGDRVLLMRALANLMSNAFKHAPADSAVHVGLCARGSEVRLSVADRGPGMPLDMRARLFQRFATGAVRKGNGLGLAMVARVARLHGARTVVDSEPGQGTAVALVLARVSEEGGDGG